MRQLFDPAIPSLVTALDQNAVLEMLHRALAERGVALDSIRLKIRDVQYKPGVHCRLLYKIKFRNPQTGRTVRQLLSVQLLRTDESVPSPSQELLARYKALGERVIPTPMLYLPKARMVLYAFPIDTSLPSLFDAIDRATMKQHLNRIWTQRKVRVRKVKVRLLGYTPQARAAFLYEVLREVKDTGLQEVRQLVGKIHAYKQAAKLFADAWALGRAANGRVCIATPVGYITSSNMTLQEKIEANRLAEFAGSQAFVNMVRQAAQAIASVHGLSFPQSSLRTPQKETQVLDRWANVLAAICPDQARRIERLRSRLAQEIEARVQMAGPVHGDFHPGNILTDGDHITLIDWDELAYGDPLVDVGRFLASLRVSALRVSASPEGLVDAEDAFLDEYLTLSQVDEKRVRLFEAISLLVAAGAPFRLQRPGWEEQTSLLIEEAERVWRKAEGNTVSPASSLVSKPSLPLGDRIRWARDETYMQALFDPHIRETYGVELTTCRVRSERETEHSYRIRYSLSGQRQDEKWKLSVIGIVKRGSCRALLQRLESVKLALDGYPDAPILPRPVAYLSSPMSMLILEVSQGIPLSSLIGTTDALEAAKKLGRALAVVHRTCLEIDKRSSLQEEISALRRQIERLKKAVAPDLYTQAEALLASIDRQSREVPARITPILRTLDPHHVLCVGDRVAFAELEEVTLSHPLIDVGNFLARLTLIGITRGKVEEVAEVADSFHHAYIAAEGVSDDGVELFEASALLCLACEQVEQTLTGEKTASLLIASAAARLNSSSEVYNV